ncbi:MAG: hypothetical protein WA940_11590 [Sphingopyxis sp.]
MERKWYAGSDRRLSRSGTTLIERIYGTLPGTRLSKETDNFSAILLVHSPVEGSDGSSASPQRIFQRLRRSIGSWRTAAGAIIEKLPFKPANLYVSARRQPAEDD